MLSPRRCLAESSPITQRTASMTFDLPQPFGPTTPVRLLGKLTCVGSTKDLKPASLILVSRKITTLSYSSSGALFNAASVEEMTTSPQTTLETFSNPAEADYTIRIQIPEFTCLCPRTGQPDFATLELEYVPDRLCVELKALKLYIWSFRDRGAFHEAVTNEIADHLAA